jgi:hypothetical protein
LRQLRLQYRGVDWSVRTDATPTITALFRQAQVARPPLGRYRPAKALGALEIPKKRLGRLKRSDTVASNIAVNSVESETCQN